LLALDLIQKTGTNAPTTLRPGQFGYDLTNQNLYIGGAASNPVLVGTVGAASTGYVNSAVTSRQTTNAALDGFTVDGSGTNLLWIVGGVTNTVTITPAP
jgi:hypothetical protein